MARTPEGKLLTDLHRRQQLALRASVVRDVLKIWPAWQPKDPSSYRAFEAAMVMLVQSRSVQSASLAARYYEMFRAADAPGSTRHLAVALAAARDEDAIRAAVSSTARAGVYKALGAGQPYEAAMRNGLVRVSGAVSREVLNGGRDTIVEAVNGDAKAIGWARVTDANPCAFCAMMAGRGPVYESKETALAGDRWHDYCACGAEPAYEGSEWPGRGREFQQMWKETRGLNELRQALSK